MQQGLSDGWNPATSRDATLLDGRRASRLGEIEPGALGHLREIVGDIRFRSLLTCIAADLSGVSSRLSLAAEAADCEALRAQSHVLIGVAVTIGASALGCAARPLNAAAHEGDPARVRALLPGILEGIEIVLEQIYRERDRLIRP